MQDVDEERPCGLRRSTQMSGSYGESQAVEDALSGPRCAASRLMDKLHGRRFLPGKVAMSAAERAANPGGSGSRTSRSSQVQQEFELFRGLHCLVRVISLTGRAGDGMEGGGNSHDFYGGREGAS